jgi:two-component system response regulator YesN
MIVDDEALFLERLEKFFQQHSDEFELIGKAFNGKEAIQLAMTYKPQIIITDVLMPEMNGIEMIRLLKDQHPSAHYVIFSAFSDFQYAKDAIQLDVCDYLVKVPLNEGELYGALSVIANKIYNKELKESEVKKLMRSRLEHKYRLRRQLFNEFFNGDISFQQLRTYSDEMDVNWKEESYCCFIVLFDHYNDFAKSLSQPDQWIIKYGIVNVIEETILNEGTGFAMDFHKNQFVGFMSWPYMRNSNAFNNRCLTMGRQIITNIKSYIKQSVSICMTEVFFGWENIRESYSQAMDVSQDLYYQDDRNVVTRMMQRKYSAENDVIAQNKWNEWLQCLHQEPEDTTRNQFMSFSQWVVKNPVTPLWMNKSMAYGIEYVRGLLNQPPVDDREKETIPYLQFRKQTEYMIQLLDHRGNATHDARSEIERAKKYIQKRITEKITLKEVANEVNLSPAYFSGVFKKETNESFTEYVNRLKMERAQRMLSTKEYSNIELSDMLGINNERYFATLFKDYTGMTPKQYRKLIKKPQ